MSPARKLEQMFRIRGEHVRLLKKRLRREHPDSTDMAFRQLVVEHSALVRED